MPCRNGPLTARKRRWKSLPEAVIETAWVYAVDVAYDVPLLRVLRSIETEDIGRRAYCGEASSVPTGAELGS